MRMHCIIIGYGPGLSHSIAKRFSREGYSIVGISRNLAGGSDSQHKTTLNMHLAADASDENQLNAAIQSATDSQGPVEVMVYNVAAMVPGPLATVSTGQLRTSLDANVIGALVAAQAVIPQMMSAHRGSLLFTGGGFALHPSPGFGVLSIGKAAIRNLALTLATELAETRIHAATVTIAGFIKPGTNFDPEKIADVFWVLHAEQPGCYRSEVVYSG